MPSCGGIFLGIADLRKALFKDILTRQNGGTSCPYCSERSPSQPGRSVEVRSWSANEPELLILHNARQHQIEEARFENDVRRFASHADFNIKDWTPKIFPNPADYQPSSLRYKLVGALFYHHNPLHYVPFIRLGKEENISTVSLPKQAPSTRYGRLNDGMGVMFDDLRKSANLPNAT